jgi:hypothetical protein
MIMGLFSGSRTREGKRIRSDKRKGQFLAGHKHVAIVGKNNR